MKTMPLLAGNVAVVTGASRAGLNFSAFEVAWAVNRHAGKRPAATARELAAL
jgi:hypothetical protein